MKVLERTFPVSEGLWERAERVIPCGTQTLSKAPSQFVRGVTPRYLSRGKGSHVWDVDNNTYIDYPMALGPILLGYDYGPVTEAVIGRVREGTTFTLMHPLEVEVAEMITEMVPSAEMVRFAKNGADVTSAAVKAARAYTGRTHIAFSGYHGCQDWYAISTERNKGIPKGLGRYMHPFEYNDIESLRTVLEEKDGKVACVIIEVPSFPPETNMATGKNFLQQARDLAHEHGALFILDEIVTGFRYSPGGAQALYNVEPDLSCFGKGMANGFPISAVVGKREFMREFEEVFFSMTYSGDTVGLAAAKATLTEISEKPVIGHIWEMGRRLHHGINSYAGEIGLDFRVVGDPPRGGLCARNEKGEEDLLLKSIFMQETVRRGILFGGPVFTSFSHTPDDIDKTVYASCEALDYLKKAVESGTPEDFLEGEPVGQVFRKRD